MSANVYYGKYKAKVQNINDPQKRGRIRVLCPRVLGESLSSWCEPCVPVCYDFGGDFALPKVGETVWVEFEEGDVNKPIYTGGWWSENSTPSNLYNTANRYIYWNGCKIEMQGGMSPKIVLSVGESTITISNYSIVLDAKTIITDNELGGV